MNINSKGRVLVTSLGFGASWNGSAETTPWSVYATVNGVRVQDGGEYPDKNPESVLIGCKMEMETACKQAESIAGLLNTLGIDAVIEEIGDA
jgi:hypothetical protein